MEQFNEENIVIIVGEQNGKRVYLAELKGDPYYTEELTLAKAFLSLRSAEEYNRDHHVQVGEGIIMIV